MNTIEVYEKHPDYSHFDNHLIDSLYFTLFEYIQKSWPVVFIEIFEYIPRQRKMSYRDLNAGKCSVESGSDEEPDSEDGDEDSTVSDA